jgi:hypothetical protein
MIAIGYGTVETKPEILVLLTLPKVVTYHLDSRVNSTQC